VARPGLFDTDGVPWGWFDTCGQDQGWFDRDLLTYPAAVPPPPPPPKPRPRPRPVAGGGGGGGVIVPYCPPDWLKLFYTDPDALPVECDDEPTEIGAEAETDYALLYLPGGARGSPVRALASGVVERVVDSRGRTAVVLTAADGTRYWYADLGRVDVAHGARVEVDQVIARTKPGARPIPTVVPAPAAPADPASAPAQSPVGALPAGPPSPAPRPKPAQVVFVEAPPPAEEPSRPRVEPPAGPTRPPVQPGAVVWMLLPKPGTQPEPPPAPAVRATPIRDAILSLSLVAALLSAAYLLDRRAKASRQKRGRRRKGRPGRRRS